MIVRVVSGVVAIAWIVVCGCGGSAGGGASIAPPPPVQSPQPFLPLKVGDIWTYACYLGTPAPAASTFPKTNQVLGVTMVNGTNVYEYQIQIPSSPTQNTTQIQLVANDGAGNSVLFGYMANPGSSPMPIASPTIIVAQNPGANGTTYDYEAQGGGIVPRVFCCTEPTHKTIFGVFTVDAYFDGSHVVSAATDGYGYAQGKGAMEEDHNFNDPDPSKRIDCLIVATPAPAI